MSLKWTYSLCSMNTWLNPFCILSDVSVYFLPQASPSLRGHVFHLWLLQGSVPQPVRRWGVRSPVWGRNDSEEEENKRLAAIMCTTLWNLPPHPSPYLRPLRGVISVSWCSSSLSVSLSVRWIIQSIKDACRPPCEVTTKTKKPQPLQHNDWKLITVWWYYCSCGTRVNRHMCITVLDVIPCLTSRNGYTTPPAPRELDTALEAGPIHSY